MEHMEKTIQTEKPYALHLSCDSANIEIYCWGEEKTKFEITKRIRGVQNKDVLEDMLDDYEILIAQEGDYVSFKSKYHGKIKNPADFGIDLRLYIPKKIKSLECVLDVGKIVIYDDIKCDISALINMANASINRFEGRLNLKAEMCDLRILGGAIKKGSDVDINLGNIQVKAELENSNDYSFRTNVGNIDLSIPRETNVSFNAVGNVEASDFEHITDMEGIKIKSGMGRIAIKNY